jgi:hypothetical protein
LYSQSKHKNEESQKDKNALLAAGKTPPSPVALSFCGCPQKKGATPRKE